MKFIGKMVVLAVTYLLYKKLIIPSFGFEDTVIFCLCVIMTHVTFLDSKHEK